MQRAPVSLGQMREIAALFQIEGEIVDACPYGTGHIHDTFAVTFKRGTVNRYIFQRINREIFKNVDQLMENICRVTRHIHDKLGHLPEAVPERTTLTIIPARDGRPYTESAEGDCWRVYIFVEGARTHDVLENASQAYEAAKAFGTFQKLLTDLPPPPLHEIIPGFHDTPRRLASLEQAITEDTCNRAAECRDEIDFAGSFQPLADTVTAALASGELPTRVTHNDTKINNVMLDDNTGAGVCVIDLDTVMPGSLLYDFGDQIRSCIGLFDENERDPDKIRISLDFFESLVKGYLEVARGFLTDREIDLLPFSGMLITFTVGIRFLTDYLQGDIYFKTNHANENHDRARSQLALVRVIRENESAMNDIVRIYR